MSKIKLMEPIDHFIIKKIDELQSQREVQRVLDNYSSLDEKAQEVIKGLLTVALFLIPLLVVLIFVLSNQSVRKSHEVKQELINTSQALIMAQGESQVLARSSLGSSPVNNQGAFQSIIGPALRSVGVDSNKISTSNYEVIEHEGLINQSIMEVKFQGFSNNEFFDFLNTLSQRQKVRIERVNVKKGKSSQLLEGLMTLHYYSQEQL